MEVFRERAKNIVSALRGRSPCNVGPLLPGDKRAEESSVDDGEGEPIPFIGAVLSHQHRTISLNGCEISVKSWFTILYFSVRIPLFLANNADSKTRIACLFVYTDT